MLKNHNWFLSFSFLVDALFISTRTPVLILFRKRCTWGSTNTWCNMNMVKGEVNFNGKIGSEIFIPRLARFYCIWICSNPQNHKLVQKLFHIGMSILNIYYSIWIFFICPKHFLISCIHYKCILVKIFSIIFGNDTFVPLFMSIL